MGESSGGKKAGSGLRFAGVGFSFAALVAAGWFGGRWCDQRFETEPWGATAGVLLGVGLGVFDLIRVSAALEREDREAKS